MRIVAIIPAHNEGKTIANVVRVATAHPDIADVIVVDDGSTDDTVSVARRAGAGVIRHAKNRGKAETMETGVRAAKGATHFLFLDADLIGFQSGHINRLIEPFEIPRQARDDRVDARNDVGMTVGIRDRGNFTTWLNVWCLPWISGERVVTRSLWESVPSRLKHGFQIELALNSVARRLGMKTMPVVLRGLSIVRKEQKVGFVRGFAKRLSMIGELIAVSVRLMLQ